MNDFEGLMRGLLPLCMVEVVLLVLLVMVVTWLYGRRRKKGKTPETPPILQRIWDAIYNFFMLPPEEREAQEQPSDEPSALPASEPLPTAPPSPPPTPFEAAPTRPEAPPAAQEPPPSPPGEAPAAEPPAPGETAFGAIVSMTGSAEPEAAPTVSPAPAAGAVSEETPEPESASDEGASPAEAPSDSVEVLRVWRDLADGSLIVDFGGWRYRDLSTLNEADLRRRLMLVLQQLNEMAGRTPSVPVSTMPNYASPASPPSPTYTTPTPAKKPEESERPGMLRQLGQMVLGQRGAAAEEGPPEPTIADQVEEMLQQKLVHSPFAGRNIHVRSSVTGSGLSIVVDDRSYEEVGQVEDEKVREFLQSVIQEWAARQ